MFSDAARLVRRNWLATIVALFATTLVFGGARQVVNVSPVSATEPSATGWLVLDDVAYEFTPDTCYVDQENFVASGGGEMNGEDYWVSASPSVVELTFGSSVEGASVPEGSLWAKTVGTFEWNVEGSKLDAAVTLFERSNADGLGRSGHLTIACRD